MKRREFWIPILAAGALGASFAWNKLSDPDVWWHLAGGKLFWQAGIPAANTFSHSHPGYPWKDTQWLFEAVLRVFDAAGGLMAVELFPMLLVAASFALAADTARRCAGRVNLLHFLPILLVALSASRFRFVPRPHLVSCVGLALLLHLHARRPKRLPLWFAAVGIVWGNCHAGVIFGAAAALAMAAAAVLSGDRADGKRLLAACGAFVAASLVNPHPGYAYAYSFMHLDIGSVVPLEEFRHASWPQYATFLVFAGLAALAVPFRLRRKDYLYPLLVLGFLPLSLYAVRIIPKFVIVSLPGLCAAAQEGWDAMARRRRGRIASFGVAAVLLMAASFLGFKDWARYAVSFPFGWGVHTRMVPEGAARFAEENGLGGRMYNDLHQGGYLIWRLYPARPVFMDGRVQTYPPDFIREVFGAMRDPRGWSAMMEKYGIDYAITARWPTGREVGTGILFEGMGWPLVCVDGIAYVYARPGSENARRTAARVFRLIRSRDDADALCGKAVFDPAGMRAELNRIERGRLIRDEDFLRFGAAADASGDRRLAEDFFRDGIALNPDNLPARIGLARVMVREGRFGEARRELEETRRRGKGRRVGVVAGEMLGRLPPRGDPP